MHTYMTECFGRGRWRPCGFDPTMKGALKTMAHWKQYHLCDKFRIRKYVRDERKEKR